MKAKLKKSLEIPITGRYYVYCQLYISHSDSSYTTTGFHVTTNDSTLLEAEYSNREGTLHSGGVFFLKEGDLLTVKLKGNGVIGGDYTTNFLGAYLL